MQSAAFFRVEGALVSRSALLAPAWMAANGQRIRGRLARLGAVALAAPVSLAAPGRADRLGWSALRDTSADRLRVLGEEYFHAHLKPSLTDVGMRLLASAREQGRAVVLISSHPDCIVSHLAQHLDAEHLVCNRLALRDGVATGHLEEPVIGDAISGQWASDWAAGRSIDLSTSYGYGARGGDAVLLSALGHPCAVRPDRSLRQRAHDLSWPVVDA